MARLPFLDGTKNVGNSPRILPWPDDFDAVTADYEDLGREKYFWPGAGSAGFRTTKKAINLANDSDYGLGRGLSGQPRSPERVARGPEANRCRYGLCQSLPQA